MARQEIIVGLDVGTTTVRTIVAQKNPKQPKPLFIGIGEAPSTGIRKGAVVDIEETVKAISASLEETERIAGTAIEHVYVSIGGEHIISKSSRGIVAVSRADGEISEEDVARVINAAQAITIAPNKEILHVIPISFTLDSQEQIKDPVGMNGVRLEANVLIIEGAVPFIKNLTKCVHESGVEIDDLILTSLASSKAVLSPRQRELGVVVIDLGGGTTSLAVFEEDTLIHTAVLPVGGGHVTNDIAIGLRTSIDIAERVKRDFGSALPLEVSKRDKIDLAKIDSSEEGIVLRRHLAEIIEARIVEIFTLVDQELKKIDRSKMLPAGAVLVGGGAKMPGIVDLAKETLSLPVQIGFPQNIEGIVDRINDPSFATVVGLVLWGLDEKVYSHRKFQFPGVSYLANPISKLKRLFKTFLP